MSNGFRGRAIRIPIRRVDLRGQRAHMRARWPHFRCDYTTAGLTCVGLVRPTDLSGTYAVRIEMGTKGHPRVYVDDPSLMPRTPTQRIPHTYSLTELCAFHPREWSADRIVAITVVPWTYRWLYVYENWHATGEWDAHGIHPN